MTKDGRKDQGDRSPGNYKLSRLNATRHGILSQHTLLPWEPWKEYVILYDSLKQEYAPAGPTEAHLVEEIAGIIWRKRRLRMAEASAFRNQFQRVITDSNTDIVRSSLIGLRQPASRYDLGMESILTMDPAEVSQEIRNVQENLRIVQEAQKVLETRGSKKYQAALRTLLPEVREWWEEAINEDLKDYRPHYEPTPEGLLEFLEVEIIPYYSDRLLLLSNRSDIISQTQGESTDTDRLEKLARYEVFPDRKLERILSMVLKLQALRREREKSIE